MSHWHKVNKKNKIIILKGNFFKNANIDKLKRIFFNFKYICLVRLAQRAADQTNRMKIFEFDV